MSVKKQQRKRAHVLPKTKRFGYKVKPDTAPKSEPKKSPKTNNKALVIAHEIKFAKLLAGNDKKVRDKVLKNLKKWLTLRSQSSFAFVEHDFMRLWKGLYYCMWMSDKPLIQEELAESLSKLVHCFSNKEDAMLYTKCTLWTLASEWFGIDQHRLDKFQMLVRRIIRQTFEMCKKKSWDREWVDGVQKIIEGVLIESKATLGFSLHMTELYMEELSKVSRGTIPEDIVTELVRPFAIQLAARNDERQIRHVMKHIFRYLIFQSDVGMDYIEKFEAWRHAGFPKGDIEAMQKVEIDEDDDEDEEDDDETKGDSEEQRDNRDQPDTEIEKALDPRAGRVDVELPQLPFNAKAIADLVMEYRFHPSSTTETRRQTLRIAREFNELAEGKMPLGVKKVRLHEGSRAETNSKNAALRLLEFERELYSDTIRGKHKRKSTPTTEEEEFDFDAGTVPTSKKLKVEVPESTKKQKKNKNKPTDDTSGLQNSKVKSKKIKSKVNLAEKRQGTVKSIQEDAGGVIETPKRKKKINARNDENSTVESKLVANVVQKKMQKLQKATKLTQMNGESLQDAKLAIPAKKLIQNETKKAKRNTSDGDWNISENVSPISPSTENSRIPNSISLDNFVSTNQFKANDKLSWTTPVKTKQVKTEVLGTHNTKIVSPNKAQIIQEATASVTSSKKKVKIVLQRNTAQHTSEYLRQLRQSPAIPFDANRKPPVGVLKPSPIPSPVNPFYKRNFK